MKNELTPNEKTTVTSYDTYASDWASKNSVSHRWEPYMEQFSHLLPSGKILEIGSGGGRDAKELIRHGYDYTGTDVSEGLLRVARENNPGASFIKRSVYDLDFADDLFDGFWCVATLLHIPKSRIDEALRSISRVVKNGGIGFIATKEGKGEKLVEQPPPDGVRFFAYYEQQEFANHLEHSGYDIIAKDKSMSPKTVWLTYLVKVAQ